jgi:Uma2 family endonuclease
MADIATSETSVLASIAMRRESATIDSRSEERRPVHFPEEECVPESEIHLIVRVFLYDLLRFILSGRAFVGSDQFVYFDGADPKRCVAPDVYVGSSDTPRPVRSWKTWERGTPSLCVEIDNSAVPDRNWDRKLAHYRALGVRELVYFLPEEEPGKRLRVWDRIDDDLVERVVEGDTTWCNVLGMQWVVSPIEGAEVALRVAEDREGRRLIPNRVEAERIAREREQRERERVEREREREQRERERVEREREKEQQERERAEARVAELEAELKRRSDG